MIFDLDARRAAHDARVQTLKMSADPGCLPRPRAALTRAGNPPRDIDRRVAITARASRETSPPTTSAGLKTRSTWLGARARLQA